MRGDRDSHLYNYRNKVESTAITLTIILHRDKDRLLGIWEIKTLQEGYRDTYFVFFGIGDDQTV